MIEFLEEVTFTPVSRPRRPRKNARRTSGARRGEDRDFVGWDGEGWTDHVCENADDCRNSNGKCKHHYYLFGASTGDYISGESLSTKDCFDLMLKVRAENPDTINVAFSFKYDIDMIFRDLQPAAMRMLLRKNRMHWAGYSIECLPGKWLQVTRDKVTCRIYDLFSFFACSFVSALTKWKVGDEQDLEHIKAGKSQRGSFTLDNLQTDVIPYWSRELVLLVQLADKLRTIMYSADIRPAKWHGPGAVADYLFTTYKTRNHMPDYDKVPSGVLDAGQYAYAGGRFEAFRIGYHDGPVYSADINSAYPYAMTQLPDMSNGSWEYSTGLAGDWDRHRVGMFHIKFKYDASTTRSIVYDGMPGAAHYRYPTSGTIHFRHNNPGVWVHAPEFKVIMGQYSEGLFEEFHVIESWVYHDDGSYPFSWVLDIYRQRQEWKAPPYNPAELAAKLGINSLYGKLAQRVGGRDEKPKWHNLEMAGHITSTCRAMLYEASWRQYRDLIAYQTDGIYSTRPLVNLPNGAGTKLGQWEVDEYSGMMHLQSGVYWLRDLDGNWLRPKSRGVPQQHMDFQRAMDSLVNKTSLTVVQNQFIRFGIANMRRGGLQYWRTWQMNDKDFSFGGSGFGSAGKRLHIAKSCKECVQGIGHHEGLHTLMLSPKGYRKVDGVPAESAAHHLPWRDLGVRSANTEQAQMEARWGNIDE